MFDQSIPYCPACGLQRQPYRPPAAYSSPQPYQATYIGDDFWPPQPSSAALAPYSGYPGTPYPVTPYSMTHGPDLSYLSQIPRKRKRSHLFPFFVVGSAVALLAVVAAVVYVAYPRGESAADIAVPPGPGVAYHSNDGHFAARFPDTPQERVIPASVGSLKLKIVVAGDPVSRTVVESEGVSAPLPTSEVADALGSATRSIASGAGATLTSDVGTTFQGHVAEQGEFTERDGTPITVMVFAYSNRRIYLMAAPSDSFDDLSASFVAVA